MHKQIYKHLFSSIFFWQHHYRNSCSAFCCHIKIPLMKAPVMSPISSKRSFRLLLFKKNKKNIQIAFSALGHGQLASQQDSSPDMQLLVHQPVTHYMYSLLYLCVCAPFSAPKLLCYYLVRVKLHMSPPPSHNAAVVNRCICRRHCGRHCPLCDHTTGLYRSDVRL